MIHDPRVEEAALAFVNAAPAPDVLVARFRDAETGEEAISAVSAAAILNWRDRELTAPGFRSLAKVIEAGHLDTDLVRRAVDRIFGRGAKTDCPVLLFPVRLETRIFDDRTLRVRVYPDQLMIESHQAELTENEIRAGLEFHEQADQPAAWRSLAQRYGPARAAWIVRETRERSPGDGTAGGVRPGWHQAPALRTLPDFFMVFVYRQATDREPAYAAPGTPIDKELTIPSPANRTKGRMDDDAAWFLDFRAAKAAGMAVEIELVDDRDRIQDARDRQQPLFARIIAVGIRSADAHQGQERLLGLLTNHRYTDGLAFVEPGAPTSNTSMTNASPSPSEQGGADSLAAEALQTLGEPSPGQTQFRPLHSTNADRLGLALGLPDGEPGLLRVLAGADNRRASYARDLQTLLWPATGDYMLRVMLDLESQCFDIPQGTLARIGEHFRNYVKAAGPLPTLRFGKLPYGILPALSWKPWAGQEHDGPTAHSILGALADKWLARSQDPEYVPRVGGISDTDKELLQILSMGAVSSDFFLRLFTTTSFYEDSNFDISFDPILPEAQATVNSLLRPGAEDLPGCVKELPLLTAFACGDKPLPEPLVEPDGGDLLYLSSLCDDAHDSAVDEPHTLLAQLGSRSIDRVEPWPDEEEIKDAIEHLAEPFKEGAQPSSMALDQWRAVRREFIDSLSSFERQPASGFQQVQIHLRRFRALGETRGVGSISSATWLAYHQDLERLAHAHHRLVLNPRPPDRSQPSFGPRFPDGPAAERREVLLSRQAITAQLKEWEDLIVEALARPAPAEPPVKPDIDRLFRETLDLCTHRLDAWITSLATQRLDRMRDAKPDGIHLGAYGWVEYLTPGTPASSGYIHSPSAKHSATAAVLYGAFLSQQQRHQNAGETGFNSYRINLNSIRVQKAMRLLAGVRDGQELGALLGYHFERELHESPEPLDQFIDDFRDAFPLVANRIPETATDGASTAERAARSVVDGLMLLQLWLSVREPREIIDLERLLHKLNSLPQEGVPPGQASGLYNILDSLKGHDRAGQRQEIFRILETLVDLRDAASDLLLSEAIYQTTRGNHERAGAALEAISGSLRAPEIESVKTPVSGSRLSHRVCLLLPEAADGQSGLLTPRGRAEPRLEAWFSRVLGDMAEIECRATYPRVTESGMSQTRTRTLTLADLQIGALDLFYMAHAQPGAKTRKTEIEQRIAFFVRQRDPLARYDGEPMRIDVGRTGGTRRSVAEALYLAGVMHDMIGDGAWLKPGSLADPGSSQADAAGYEQRDIDNLRHRVEEALADVSWLATVLDVGEGENLECRQRVLSAALHLAGQYGIAGAIPAGPADPDLAVLCKAAHTDLARRAGVCERILEGLQPPAAPEEEGASGAKPETTIGKLVQAMKALFGESFIVVPEYAPLDRPRLDQVWNAPGTLRGVDRDRLRLWLQQAALVQSPLARVDDALTLTEAWLTLDGARPDQSPLQFQLAQFLPGDGDAEPWLALDDQERGDAATRPEHALSLLALAPPEFASAVPQKVAGLLLDQWDELIPDKTIRSNLTFHYDRPGAQAPNCLLLAVPPEGVGSSDESWSLNALRDVVNDTLDLAKLRTVDLDALPDVAGMLPGLFFELSEP